MFLALTSRFIEEEKSFFNVVEIFKKNVFFAWFLALCLCHWASGLRVGVRVGLYWDMMSIEQEQGLPILWHPSKHINIFNWKIDLVIKSKAIVGEKRKTVQNKNLSCKSLYFWILSELSIRTFLTLYNSRKNLGGRCKSLKSTSGLLDRIGCRIVGQLGISFFTSLNQQLFRNIAYVWYSWHFNKAVFVYLCIWQLGISVLMSSDLGLFKNIAL